MDNILNPELIKAVQNHLGLITLAMLLMAAVAIALTRGTDQSTRTTILVILIAIYAGVIVTALLIEPDKSMKAEVQIPRPQPNPDDVALKHAFEDLQRAADRLEQQLNKGQ